MKNRLFFSLLLCAALLGGSLPAFSNSADDSRAQMESRRAEIMARRNASGQTPAAPVLAPAVTAPAAVVSSTTPAPVEPVIEKVDKITLADLQDKLVVTPDLIWQVRDQTLLYDLKKAWEEKQNQLAADK